MLDVIAIRQGLAGNLAAVFLPDHAHVYANMVSDPGTPSLQIWPDEIDYQQTLQQGVQTGLFIVQALVGVTGDQAVQQTLDAMLASEAGLSVLAAIEADTDLTKRLTPDGQLLTGQAAAALDVTVVRCTGYRIYDITGGPFVGAAWEVEVKA